MPGLIEKFQSLNDVDLTKLQSRVNTLRQQIQDALNKQGKLSQEEQALLDAIETAKKRAQ